MLIKPEPDEAGQFPISSRSIRILTVLNLASTVVGAVSSLVIANLFGASRTVEIYFAAATLQMMVLKLTQSGQFSTLFVSLYVHTKADHGSRAAHELFACLLNWVCLWAGLIGLIFFLTAGKLMAWLAAGFNATDQTEAANLFRWLLVPMLISIFEAFFNMKANAEGRYGGPECVRLAENILSMILILVLASRYGIWAIVMSAWMGRTVNFVGNSFLLLHSGYRHTWVFSSRLISRRTIFVNFGYTMLYTAITQVMTGVATAALTFLPAGSMAIYKYVEQIYNRLNSTLFRPITVVLLNTLAADKAAGGRMSGELRDGALQRGAALWAVCTTVVGAPAGFWLAALWGKNRFPLGAIDEAAWLTLLFMFVLYPFFISVVANRVLLITTSTRTYYLTLTISQVLTALLAWPMVRWGGIYGAMSLQLFNVLSFWLFAVIIGSGREWVGRLRRDLAPLLRWLPAAGTVAVVAGWLSRQTMNVPIDLSLGARWLEAAQGAFLAVGALGGLLLLGHWSGRREPAKWMGSVGQKIRSML